MQEDAKNLGLDYSGCNVVFLADQNTSFTKDYKPTVSNFPAISPLPIPSEFPSYPDYEIGARNWAKEIKKARNNHFILPLPTSLFYSRPPVRLPREISQSYKFTSKKNPKLLLSKQNLDEIFTTCITEKLILPDREFKTPLPKSHQTPTIGDYITAEPPWNTICYPQEPKPTMFKTFEDYKNALTNWTNYLKKMKLPTHPKDLNFETPNSLDYKEIIQPQRQSLQCPDCEFKPQTIRVIRETIKSLREAYTNKFAICPEYHTDNWRRVFNYTKKNCIPSQIDELIFLLEKWKDYVLEIINFGPTGATFKPTPTDYIEQGQTYQGDQSMTKEEIIHSIILSDYSLKSIRITTEKNIKLFDFMYFPVLLKICEDCTSTVVASKILYFTDAFLTSMASENYFDLLLSNPSFLKVLCNFIGRFNFIPRVSPICYSLPLYVESKFARSYQMIVTSALLYTIHEYVNEQNEVISQIITHQFYDTAREIRYDQSAIINAFKKSKEERARAMDIIILCLTIPYRPFQVAIFSPAPIIVFSMLLESELDDNEEYVNRIMNMFIYSDALRGLSQELLQFDLFMVSKNPKLLVPLVRFCLKYLYQLNYPVITNSQLQSMIKCFSSAMEPTCYVILHDLVPIFLKDSLFLERNDEEFKKSRTTIMQQIVSIVCQSDVSISNCLFDSLALLLFEGTTFAPSNQFWMVFLAGLVREDNSCKSCWHFLTKIFLLNMTSLLPEFFQNQMTSIFKSRPYEYCVEVLKFISAVSNCASANVLEKWLMISENNIRSAFQQIYDIVQKEKFNASGLSAYSKIITSTAGKGLIEIVCGDQFSFLTD
ncbi:hypothetical protein TVAG_403380 [Trichomonas vaginalis G3]|uniref:Uncharacterized protein n=1 Tax=Trichomonas vaginalis (strain ATCC PRA-98 / G3) TaxID=412133 RepID=A2F8X4_TRIV3|nr:SCA1 complex scaffold protein SCAA family [Trichomonas vaginalis G3]EAX98656.1 hypothetical protein TVAG_403380 [Trichomonas vaginalis G3]KAI5508430.1 SCA1 complex scaffold protein SCAA family [Trichomonas vaginalis G3]|eukprot:XP_001311586.1 hypothetical protein [Trichomonas vaginalis G3]